jgi:WD40 repeat protein
MKKHAVHIFWFCCISTLLIVCSIGIYYFATNRPSPNIYRIFQDSGKDFTIFENVGISNDSSLTAAGSEQSESDSWVRIWNTQTGKLLRTLQGRETTGADDNNPIAFTFSPNNKQMAIAQNEFKVWDIASGKLLRSIKLNMGNVWIVKFSDDGKMLACATQKNVILWDWTSNKKPIILHAEKADVYGIDFSANGKFLISAGGENKVKLWRVADGHLLKFHSEHHANILACAFVNGNTLVSSLDQSGVNILWNIQSGKLRNLTTERGKKPELLTITAYSPDGTKYIRGISGTNIADHGYRNIRMVSSLTGNILFTDNSDGSMYSLGLSNSNYFVTGALDTKVEVWKIND